MLFLESIKIVNRKFERLNYHQNRVNQTIKHFWAKSTPFSLKKNIVIPTVLDDKPVYKCRILYDKKIRNVEFIHYETEKVTSLKLVEHNEIDYQFKYADRTVIQTLFEQRERAEDILIVKNGLITDSSYCNVVFYDGKNWITPASPLLYGTRRAYLLEKGLIIEKKIRVEDIGLLEGLKLINAMIGLEDAELISVNEIIF